MSSWQPNACPSTFISSWGSLRLLCLVLARLWKAKRICAFFVSWDKCVCESLVNRTLVLLLQNAKTRNQAVTCLTHQSAACQACFPVSDTGHHYHKSNWTLLNFTLPFLRFGWVESIWHGKVQKETGGVVPSKKVDRDEVKNANRLHNWISSQHQSYTLHICHSMLFTYLSNGFHSSDTETLGWNRSLKHEPYILCTILLG